MDTYARGTLKITTKYIRAEKRLATGSGGMHSVLVGTLIFTPGGWVNGRCGRSLLYANSRVHRDRGLGGAPSAPEAAQ